MHMPTSDQTRVFEAESAEAALAKVTEELGSGATILEAKKVLRGGLGGFFAKEMVQLHVRDDVADAASDDPTSQAGAAPDVPGLGSAPDADSASPIERVLARIDADDRDEDEVTFGEYLRRHMTIDATSPAPAPAAPATGAPPAPPAPVSPAPSVPSRVVDPATTPPTVAAAPKASVPDEVPSDWPMWSTTTLDRIGLPEQIVEATRGLSPADDTAWVRVIAEAVETLCRPLPPGPAVLAGPRARRLGSALDLAVVRPPDPVGGRDSVAAPIRGTAREEGWLAWARGERYVHLVAGGANWRPLLFADPLAISWVGDDALPSTLTFALRLGLVLGYGMPGTGRAVARRANPVDIALTIRSLVSRR